MSMRLAIALLLALLAGGPALASEPPRLRPKGHQGVKATVERLVAAAQTGKPQAVRIAVVRTIGWGCDCPPLVFSSADGAAEFAHEFVLPRFAAGLRDATRYDFTGRMVLTGHYSGRMIDMLTWVSDRRENRRPDADELHYWQVPHPEFIVTSWCYESSRPLSAAHRLVRDRIPQCDSP